MVKALKKLFNNKGIRFLFVGGVNTAVGYGSYALFLSIGLNYLIANTLSTVVGIINSYIWNRKFTFKSKKKVIKEVPKFVLVYGISYSISMLTLFVFVKRLYLNEYLAGIINLVVTTLISWFGHKYISFKGVENEEKN